MTSLCCQPGMKLISPLSGRGCGCNDGTKAIWSSSPGGDRLSLPAAQTRTHRSLSWSHSVIPNLTLSQQPYLTKPNLTEVPVCRAQPDTSIPLRYRTQVFGNEPRKISCFLLSAYKALKRNFPCVYGKDTKFMLKTSY